MKGEGAHGWAARKKAGRVNESERELLTHLRRALLHLHKALLDWERQAYERLHGRTGSGELLKAIVTDPQFAWLRPVSELIVRIDATLETDSPETVDIYAIVSQARSLVAPDETGPPSAQRYYTALQEYPEAVIAHRGVTTVLKQAPPERYH
jgi:hypothetical protein